MTPNHLTGHEDSLKRLEKKRKLGWMETYMYGSKTAL